MNKFPFKVFIVDIIFINIVFFLVNLKFDIEKYLFFSLYITFVYLIVIYFNGMFDKKGIRKIDILFKAIKISVISLFTIAALAYIDWTFKLPRFMILTICIINAIGIYIVHTLYYSRNITRQNCIVIGRKRGVCKLIEKEYNVLGFMDNISDKVIDNKPWLGLIENVKNVINNYKIRVIIFALGNNERSEILDTILKCYDLDIEFKIIPELHRYVITKDNYGFLSDIIIKPASMGYMVFKRIIDISVSFFSMILLFPIFIMLGLFIKLDSKGPVFYLQERLGRYGKRFKVIKFRTMIQDAEKDSGPVIITHKTVDPRVTKLGAFLRKTHLDELPQLFNILVGDMTIVGPRPERPIFSKELDNKIDSWNKRLYIKPGLTGFAQVSCIGSLEPENKIEKDLYYIKNMSLLFDIKIIIFTAFKILRGR